MPDARIEIEREDGVVDAFVAYPDTPGDNPPVILLGDGRHGATGLATEARRLSAHRFFVLVPDLKGLGAEARREAAVACVDHLADLRGVDDTRVGVAGFGACADAALSLAAWRSERIAAVAAYGPSRLGVRSALEIANRINGVVRLGYTVGITHPRAGVLEAALGLAGVPFDVEVGDGAPDGGALLDLFHRALWPSSAAGRGPDGQGRAGLNP
ncbi:hypothetical protein [Phenylobacterium sp. SCN 70-31]|uniref:dienelactone hydrolase family protein n=1 Tax=Phenylobacterium sp. SCN 70-31 TaxID=1660129 RepID=UPI0008687634|nr:hypothetical protein [Phenylobacterium sp. SCN 70-31]ODT89610.1 MAG: hypothetical protein ABS78_01955 [Phenylobacterium sp. SCN 70-31]